MVFRRHVFGSWLLIIREKIFPESKFELESPVYALALYQTEIPTPTAGQSKNVYSYIIPYTCIILLAVSMIQYFRMYISYIILQEVFFFQLSLNFRYPLFFFGNNTIPEFVKMWNTITWVTSMLSCFFPIYKTF